MFTLSRSVAAFFLMTAMLLSTACDKGSMVDNSKIVVSTLNEVLPMFESAGIGSAKVREAVEIGNRLVAAFDANRNAEAVILTSSLITAFEGIVIDTTRISDPTRRTIILVSLAAGNIALHHIADELAKNAPVVSGGMRGAPAVSKVAVFKAKKSWRCRSSQTGRFEKMEQCRKFPATTVVETY